MIFYEQESPEDEATSAEVEAHIRAHLSAVADSDDDPDTHADDVRVYRTRIPEKLGWVLISGSLDAEPSAPYLAADFDPYAGVDPDLFAAEVDAALTDEEALRG